VTVGRLSSALYVYVYVWTMDVHVNVDDGRETTDGRRRTGNDGRETTDGKRRTGNDGRVNRLSRRLVFVRLRPNAEESRRRTEGA